MEWAVMAAVGAARALQATLRDRPDSPQVTEQFNQGPRARLGARRVPTLAVVLDEDGRVRVGAPDGWTKAQASAPGRAWQTRGSQSSPGRKQ